MRYVMGLLVMAGAFAAWIVILFTGKQPQGLQEILVLGTSYTIRSDAYFFLVTETYPPFSQDMKAAIESQPGGTGSTGPAVASPPAASPVVLPPQVEGP